MKVFGVDFTSSPSASGSKAKAAKWMTLARCVLDRRCLKVESLDLLNGEKEGDYSQLAALLSSEGSWIAGIDVPFGMPIECIEYFQWLKGDDRVQDWDTYVNRCRDSKNRKVFKTLIESWRHPVHTTDKGEKERVRKCRIVDTLIGSQSPMNCIRPAVGSMFYEACIILKQSPASIPPLRYREDKKQAIVEAYPRLVVDRLGLKNYKEADGLDGVRQAIVNQLTSTNIKSAGMKWYGLHVQMGDDLIEKCVTDRDGDRIDSVLCAVQAAWAFRQKNFGMPQFASCVMQNVLALEGWVADPFLKRWSNPNKP